MDMSSQEAVAIRGMFSDTIQWLIQGSSPAFVLWNCLVQGSCHAGSLSTGVHAR
jgi:hypothetical protein